jgi:D-sedoheptulose 7-phosphate isomerase
MNNGLLVMKQSTSRRSIVDGFFKDIKSSCDKISANAIDAAVSELFVAWRDKKRVFVIGNGGSASTATHLACDLAKNVAEPGLRVLSLNDNIPLVSALTNDIGFENVFAEQLNSWLEPGDVLIAISVHGGGGRDRAGVWSQNLIKAITLAKVRGARTIGIAGFEGGLMKDLVDVFINTPSNDTFQVESLHVMVHHALCASLRSRIEGSR